MTASQNSIAIDSLLPDFTINATNNTHITLSTLRGKNIILYFYPKDNTPGCTTEGQDFTSLHTEFSAQDTCIFGISRESLTSHERFKAKYSFPFELISDPDEVLCKLFDVIKLKKLYGKEYLGIERSTFLTDKKGVLRNEWRTVKVKGHAEAVLEAVKALS